MLFRNNFTEKVVLPLSDIFLGLCIAQMLDFLLESQNCSKGEIKTTITNN